jgi:hypothetical protein
MLGMDSPSVDYCGLCDGSITTSGSSADQCMTVLSCESFQGVAPTGTEAAFTFNEVAYDPIYIVMGEMNPASNKALDIGTFRAGLRAFFTASETTGVQVTAYPMQPDPLFKQMLPNLRNPQQSTTVDASHPMSTPMKVVFTTHDESKAQAIKDALSKHDSEEHDDMLLFLQVCSGEGRIVCLALIGSIDRLAH